MTSQQDLNALKNMSILGDFDPRKFMDDGVIVEPKKQPKKFKPSKNKYKR